MRKDRRPYWMKKLNGNIQDKYFKHFIKPEFDKIGKGCYAIKPWHIEIFGAPVKGGNFINFIAAPDKKIRLTVWPESFNTNGIEIGDYALLCPGVRISAATEIKIGKNCMLASGVYITDADWHEIYDRNKSIGKTKPVIISDNVWLGDSSIVCKGVTIGENVIIGAGSVVVSDIPENVIAAGNPAKIIRELDPEKEIRTRGDWMSKPRKLIQGFDILEKDLLKGNTTLGWLKSILFPSDKD
ncbi:MAG: acetyltransferase [Deltaproteobacteria bacterium]|nr:MAG: acetyltransferase [Deltaproteobacteria bacterium]